MSKRGPDAAAAACPVAAQAPSGYEKRITARRVIIGFRGDSEQNCEQEKRKERADNA